MGDNAVQLTTPSSVQAPCSETTPRSGQRILAFDIGIKNLAYCLLEVGSATTSATAAAAATPRIIDWANVNLLNDGAEVGSKKKPVCQRCAKGGGWGILAINAADGSAVVADDAVYCARHIPASAPALTDSDGKALKGSPKLADLRAAAERLQLGRPAKGANKLADWLALFAGRCSLPLKAFAKKAPPTMHTGMEALHDGILAMILDDSRYNVLLTADRVLLENQPVLKNPTMKTVQVLLFAALRDTFIAEKGSAPPFQLVHAGKKVRGAAAAAGDAGYADRKDAGEARVREWLEKHAAGSVWDKKFTGAAKKSDLADALCMCLDAATAATVTKATPK
jgi:hypothetical protein